MSVVELRQYTLRPGQRSVLVELFDREFVESQEELGARIVGQFRDLDRPDRFVWLRAFPDMGVRLRALTEFYGGPVWKRHAAAANATMIDVDDVLLLRPTADFAPPSARPPAPAAPPQTDPAVRTDPAAGPERAADPAPGGAGSAPLVAITVFPLRSADDTAGFLEFLRGPVEEVAAQPGRRRLAELVTEPAENDFPALPVRAGEHVVVTVAGFPGTAAHAAYQDRLRNDPAWAERIRPELSSRLGGEPERLRLAPTPRSWLR